MDSSITEKTKSIVEEAAEKLETFRHPKWTAHSANPPAPQPPVYTPKQPELSIVGPQHDVPETVDPLLSTILTWPRPHLSFAEIRFRAWLTAHINAHLPENSPTKTVQYLGEGSMYVVIPRPDGKAPTTLFSCHVDTVDNAFEGAPAVGKEGEQAVKRKKLSYDSNFGTIFMDKDIGTPVSDRVGTCLGADDGIGVWIMLKMLEAKVPGGYIFHTGEERGGVGSYATLEKHKAVLELYDAAVAFDRPRCDEVITHQGSLKCASDKYAQALCDRLNKHGFAYKPSQRGVFTDTKVYRKVIPECINIGVGYENQHGMTETQDYAHAVALLDACCKVDWESLPIDRNPEEADPYYGGYNKHGGFTGGTYHAQGSFVDDYDMPTNKVGKKKPGRKAGKPPQYKERQGVFDELLGYSYDDIISVAEGSPEHITDIVMELTLEVARLRAEVAVYQAMYPGVGNDSTKH